MFLENVKMALGSLRANKLRSLLTMLGIIIGIGSVISIVSIGDSIRKMFSDLYKNYGVTQAAIMINPSMNSLWMILIILKGFSAVASTMLTTPPMKALMSRWEEID